MLINTCNQFELGFLDTIEGLDSCLYVGYTGTRAATALPGILYGEVSPSGHTPDIFAYDLFTNPSAIWGTKTYAEGGSYLDKVAGIYVGYKWYETADHEGVWTAENGYPGGYDSVVQFPFGFGLSYTTFDWTVDDIKIDGESAEEGAQLKADSKVEFTVTVTNTGERAGRDVVEIYNTAPYTKGQIEKSFVNLVGYGKTNEIEPDASETITVTVDMYDCASYDCYDLNKNGNAGYELDAGDYLFKLQTDSHNVKQVSYGGETRDGSERYELQISNIEILSAPAAIPPVVISKKQVNCDLATNLDFRPVTLRNPKERAIFKIQEGIQRGFREFLTSQNFTEVHTPKINFAGAEGGYGHSGVAVPLRTNIHEVHVVAPAHRLPRLLADFDVGNGATGGLKLAVGLSKTFRVEVSHDADFRTVYVGIAAECFQTALPYADEPDTYDGQRRAG